MQFLKTLFWVLIAVFLALLGNRNWFDVTLNLWGDLQADIKVPVLLLLVFLLGFLPPFLILRARMWSLRRRLEVREREPEPLPATNSQPPAAEETPTL